MSNEKESRDARFPRKQAGSSSVTQLRGFPRARGAAIHHACALRASYASFASDERDPRRRPWRSLSTKICAESIAVHCTNVEIRSIDGKFEARLPDRSTFHVGIGTE